MSDVIHFGMEADGMKYEQNSNAIWEACDPMWLQKPAGGQRFEKYDPFQGTTFQVTGGGKQNTMPYSLMVYEKVCSEIGISTPT